MAKQKQKSAEEEVQQLPQTSWDRMVEDWRKRPRFYLTALAVLFVLITAGWLVWNNITSARDTQLTEFNDKLAEAFQEEDPALRVQRMQSLEEEAKDADWEPTFLLQLARTCRGSRSWA